MESIEKLREIVKSFHSLKPRWDTLAAIDEVEREIGRDYMKLPVDADGPMTTRCISAGTVARK